jgi:putative ABC transport system permease protein
VCSSDLAIVTGLLGAVLGVAVGLGFGALVARLLADDGFSYVVPVGSIIVVVLLAALVAALAAALPARRAGKINVVEALAVD